MILWCGFKRTTHVKIWLHWNLGSHSDLMFCHSLVNWLPLAVFQVATLMFITADFQHIELLEKSVFYQYSTSIEQTSQSYLEFHEISFIVLRKIIKEFVSPP